MGELKLRPCPFCGSTPHADAVKFRYVVCGNCLAGGPVGEKGGSPSSAELWNGRAYPKPTEPEAQKWSIEFGLEPAHPGGQQVGMRDAEARLFLEGFPEPMVVRQRSMVKTKRFAEALARALRLPLKGSE